MRMIPIHTILALPLIAMTPSLVLADFDPNWYLKGKVTAFEERRVKIAYGVESFWLNRDLILSTEVSVGDEVTFAFPRDSQKAQELLKNDQR